MLIYYHLFISSFVDLRLGLDCSIFSVYDGDGGEISSRDVLSEPSKKSLDDVMKYALSSIYNINNKF